MIFKKISLIKTLFYLLFLCSQFLLVGQEYVYKTFDKKQGLENGFVNSLIQDDKGYLWIGTGDGLFKYDGEEFVSLDVENKLASTYINTLYKNNDEIWIGHNNGEISIIKDDEPKTIINDSEIISGKIKKIFSYKNEIWIISQNGVLLKFENEKQYTKHVFHDVEFVQDVFIKDDFFFLATMEGLLSFKIVNGNFEKLVNDFEDDNITAISDLTKTSFLLANDEGDIFKYEIDGELKSSNFAKDFLIDLRGITYITTMGTNVFIATKNQGIVELNFKSSDFKKIETFKRYNQNTGLNNNNINVIINDVEGHLWIGHQGTGLSCLLESSVTHFHELGKGFENDTKALFIDETNRWTGIDNKLICVNKISSDKKIYFLDVSYVINKIIEINKNTLIIGTISNGVYFFNKDTGIFQEFFVGDRSLDKRISDIAIDKQNLIYIGTHNGVYVFKNGVKINHFSTQNGLRHNDIKALYVDSFNRVWLGMKSSEVSRINQGEIENVSLPSNLKIPTVSDIAEDKYHNIWLTTIGEGVFKIAKNDKVSLFEPKNADFGKYCYGIGVAENNNIWIGHKNTISVIDSEGHLIDVESFEHENGTDLDLSINNQGVYIDGNDVWILSENGMIKCEDFNPHTDGDEDLEVFIVNILIDDDVYRPKDDLSLPPGKHNVIFNYKAIDLVNPDEIQYEYILEGFEEKWHVVGSVSKAIYPSLGDGVFVFKVRAFHGDDYTETKVNMSIDTPFWRQIWFLVLLLIILFTGMYLLMRYREYSSKRLQRLLKFKIDMATKKMADQNKQITQSITYAKRIQDAHLSSTKILHQSFQDHFIYHKPRDIVSGDFYWFGSSLGKLVIAIGDCTGHGVPGGFMTMLGVSQLNTIIKEKKVTNPATILSFLDIAIQKSLDQKGNAVKVDDGMDIGICVMDFENKTLEYAGARRQLFYLKNGEEVTIKGTRKSIGEKRDTVFEKHVVPLNEVDIFYLFSDGVEDQMGGPEGKKFNRKRLYKLLKENASKPCDVQNSILTQVMDDWKSSFEFQLDDMLLAGFKLRDFENDITQKNTSEEITDPVKSFL